jgi:DNA-binding CsgD family transcriptional regulator
MRHSGVHSAQVWVENALSLVDVAEGSPEAARVRIEALLPLIETAPSYDSVSKARRRLAVALLLLGDLESAAKEAQRLLSHGQMGRNEHVEAMARHLLGRVALQRGAVTEAEGDLHEALALATRRHFRLHALNTLESLARVAALTDSPAEAARLLGAVHGAREQRGIVRWPPEPEAWASIEEDVRAALGDDAFATSWAEGLALPIDEAIEYASRARGKRKRPSRGWESLTPTELEVVRHAASGLTNPQIGERMFISRGTVKVHLSHIFAKLDVASRSELAAEATRRGLDAARAD